MQETGGLGVDVIIDFANKNTKGCSKRDLIMSLSPFGRWCTSSSNLQVKDKLSISI